MGHWQTIDGVEETRNCSVGKFSAVYIYRDVFSYFFSNVVITLLSRDTTRVPEYKSSFTTTLVHIALLSSLVKLGQFSEVWGSSVKCGAV